jgi:CheY-like chemotaxis protein/DNA-binding XRE family transcriptional regulator
VIEGGGGTAAPPPARLSIVALDDDADFRQFIQSVLEAEPVTEAGGAGSEAGGGDDRSFPPGHEVRTAATPEEFFGLCEQRLPDVVLLDMKMGRADGATVLTEIRKRWPRLCVVVVTGYPSLDSMRQTFRQDVFDYLAKPFGLDELRRTLAQAAAAFNLGRRPIDRLKGELGRHIRLSRTAKGWTLKDLSESCGISVSQLSSIERGSHLPSIESLIEIAAALGQQPSDWFRAAEL